MVREAVEKICREFSGQCCIHKPLGGGAGGGAGGTGRGEAVGGAEAQQVPEVSSSTLPGAPSSSTPPCSSCRGQTTGGGYQCRYVVALFLFLIRDGWVMIQVSILSPLLQETSYSKSTQWGMLCCLKSKTSLSVSVSMKFPTPIARLSFSFPLILLSVCTSCTLCEPCSFSHDPSHNLVRARTPLSIPEHGSPAPDHSRYCTLIPH